MLLGNECSNRRVKAKANAPPCPVHCTKLLMSFFASKANLMLQLPNDCDGDSFESAMKEVFRAFATLSPKCSLFSMWY